MAAGKTARKIGLNPRERGLMMLLAIIACVIVFVGAPVGVLVLVDSRSSANNELRSAIDLVQTSRDKIRERRARKEAVLRRYEHKTPALAGYLEQTARELKLEVTDSVDRPEIPQGKKFVERQTIIHFRKVAMGPFVQWLEKIETSGNALVVSRLNIRKRSGEPNSYDIEVGVSAYDRIAEAPKKDEKP